MTITCRKRLNMSRMLRIVLNLKTPRIQRTWGILHQRGVPDLNTFLVYVPAIVVHAGFTSDNLPSSITFLGRPYDDGLIIKLAYAYEQATHDRRPPNSCP